MTDEIRTAMRLSSNLQRKFERLTPQQQAAVSAYRDALNSRADWIEAVCAALDAAELRSGKGAVQHGR